MTGRRIGLRRRLASVTIFGAVVVASCSALASDAEVAATAVELLAGYEVVDGANTIVDAPLDLIADIVRGEAIVGEDAADVLIQADRRLTEGSRTRFMVLDLERTGWADDSVNGMRQRWIIVRDASGGHRVLATGQQVRCWRGDGAMTWTTGRCP